MYKIPKGKEKEIKAILGNKLGEFSFIYIKEVFIIVASSEELLHGDFLQTLLIEN